MLSNLSLRERKFLYICLGVAILCGAYSFIAKPLFFKWEKLEKSIAEEEIKYLRFKKLVKLREDVEKEYNKYRERIKPTGSDEQEMAVLLNGIEVQASNVGLYIRKIKPLPTEETAFTREYAVQLETEGDILTLVKFLYDLQLSKQVLKVKRLDIKTKEKGQRLDSDLIIAQVVSMNDSKDEYE